MGIETFKAVDKVFRETYERTYTPGEHLAAQNAALAAVIEFLTPAQPAGAVPDGLRALSEALAPCSKAEIEAWETYAKGRGHDMHEHSLHYLFMDEKTNAARHGWKAGIAWALSLLAYHPAGQSPGGAG